MEITFKSYYIPMAISIVGFLMMAYEVNRYDKMNLKPKRRFLAMSRNLLFYLGAVIFASQIIVPLYRPIDYSNIADLEAMDHYLITGREQRIDQFYVGLKFLFMFAGLILVGFGNIIDQYMKACKRDQEK
jgi:cytochrome c biogenesis protein CcdA